MSALALPGRRLAIVLCCALFAALAALVALGAFTGVDQYATEHWMPGLEPGATASLGDALSPIGDDRAAPDLLADAWLYPASAPLSALAVALICRLLWRRGRRTAAAWWGGGFVVGVAVELLVKHVVARPALYLTEDGVRQHVTGFDHALPSGHTLRAALLAGLVACVWPRLGKAAALWLASVLVALVLAGWHTPTDIAAGLLLACAVVLVVRERLAHDLEGRRVDRGALAAVRRHERDPRAAKPEAQPGHGARTQR
jgi:membrane-associated phospholipid phosphatase